MPSVGLKFSFASMPHFGFGRRALLASAIYEAGRQHQRLEARAARLRPTFPHVAAELSRRAARWRRRQERLIRRYHDLLDGARPPRASPETYDWVII